MEIVLVGYDLRVVLWCRVGIVKSYGCDGEG